MSEIAYLTYYQKTWDVILNRAKYYYENYKERLSVQARDQHRNLSEEEKIKKNRIDIVICRNKRKTRLKNIKRIIERQQSIDIIVNKIVF